MEGLSIKEKGLIDTDKGEVIAGGRENKGLNDNVKKNTIKIKLKRYI